MHFNDTQYVQKKKQWAIWNESIQHSWTKGILEKENVNKNESKTRGHIFNIRQMECKVKALQMITRNIRYWEKEQSIMKIFMVMNIYGSNERASKYLKQ